MGKRTSFPGGNEEQPRSHLDPHRYAYGALPDARNDGCFISTRAHTPAHQSIWLEYHRATRARPHQSITWAIEAWGLRDNYLPQRSRRATSRTRDRKSV